MEEEIELSDYYYILRKNLVMIGLVFLLVFASVIIYTVKTQPVYEARSLVLVTSQDTATTILGQPAQRFDMQSQLAIVRSGSVLDPVYVSIGRPFDIDAAVIKDSNVIEITAQSTDRFTAEEAANLAAESYVNYTTEARKGEAVSVMDFISEQVDSYRDEIDSLSMDLLAYSNITKPTREQLFEKASIEQSISAKEKLYNFLLSKREEVGIVARQNSANIKIIEYARTPVFPVKPNIPLNVMLGLVLGAIAGAGAAFGYEYMRNTYKSTRDIETDFGHSVIGTLPESGIRKSEHDRKHYFYQLHMPSHRFSEHLRMLRTNIMFHAKEKDMRLIAVTSPERSDGKTTVSTNLAVSLAKNNVKVLLVDANMRNPVLHLLFRKDEGKGLSDVITGEKKLQDVIMPTDISTLNVIYAGMPDEYPAELIGSKRMAEVCREIKALDYDIVIFDNTCLEFAEASMMAHNCDAVLLVIRFDKTRRDSAQKAKHSLSKSRAVIAGIIVNASKK